MAPKKSRAQASSSQPVESTRPTRAGRKRRHSDASEVSDRPSSSQSTNLPAMASTPSKRRKRGLPAASLEPGMIIEEEEEVVETQISANPAGGPDCDGNADPDAVEGAEILDINTHTQKHVHFPTDGKSLVPLNDNEEDVDKTTATHITPYPRKIADKRRLTTSPSFSAAADGNRRVKVTSIRHSLPPQLSQDGEAIYFVAEHALAPLNEVLPERVQRRLAIHAARDAELNGLVASRKGLDAVAREQVDARISELRQDKRNALAAYREDEDELDDGMLVLESQQEVVYPELRDSTQVDFRETKLRLSQSFTQPSSQQSQEAAWQAEREQFRDTIVALSNEANTARTQLQVLEIELNALGLGQGFDAKSVLISIREAFALVRENLEEILPGSLPDDASNRDVVEILVANLKEFAERLRTQDQELYEKDNLIANLGNQIQGLLDHLAEAQIKLDKLRSLKDEIDLDNESKARDIEDYDEQLQAAQDERDALEDELAAKKEAHDALIEENRGFVKSMELLKASLEKYQAEEKKLTSLIAKMEDEHTSTIKKMNEEREKTVEELENRLDEQTQQKSDSKMLAEERQSLIVTLKGQVEALEVDKAELRGELEYVTARQQEEQTAREDAEVDVHAKDAEIDELETRIEDLEEEVRGLNAQLEEIRELHDIESTTAAAELENAQSEIEDLNKKLHSQGTEANELRLKLFEVQQTNAAKVAELEKAASERDQEYQDSIAHEVERRDLVQAALQDRNEEIDELRTCLEEVESKMRDALAERDQRIASLEHEILQKTGEIERLQGDLRATQNMYDAQIALSDEQREEFASGIAALQLTIAKHERTIITLQQETISESALHASEIEDRNARIADLNHEVAEFAEQVRELTFDKASLERRVEQEAEQMLQLQAEKEDEIDNLKAIIEDKVAKINNVEEKAREADERWQDVLAAREEEISSFQEEQTSTEAAVAVLTSNLEALRRKFREYVRATSGKVRNMRQQIAQAHAAADREGGEIEEDGARMLMEIDGLGDPHQAVVSQTTSTVNGGSYVQARKTRSKKRAIDSGIGLAADEDEDDASCMLAA